MSVSVAGIPKNRCRTTIAEWMVETRAELPLSGDQVGLSRAQPSRPTWLGPDARPLAHCPVPHGRWRARGWMGRFGFDPTGSPWVATLELASARRARDSAQPRGPAFGSGPVDQDDVARHYRLCSAMKSRSLWTARAIAFGSSRLSDGRSPARMKARISLSRTWTVTHRSLLRRRARDRAMRIAEGVEGRRREHARKS